MENANGQPTRAGRSAITNYYGILDPVKVPVTNSSPAAVR